MWAEEGERWEWKAASWSLTSRRVRTRQRHELHHAPTLQPGGTRSTPRSRPRLGGFLRHWFKPASQSRICSGSSKHSSSLICAGSPGRPQNFNKCILGWRETPDPRLSQGDPRPMAFPGRPLRSHSRGTRFSIPFGAPGGNRLLTVSWGAAAVAASTVSAVNGSAVTGPPCSHPWVTASPPVGARRVLLSESQHGQSPDNKPAGPGSSSASRLPLMPSLNSHPIISL